MAYLKIDLAFLCQKLNLPYCDIVDANVSGNALILQLYSPEIPADVEDVTAIHTITSKFVPVGGD